MQSLNKFLSNKQIVGVANPASLHCQKRGGRLEIRNTNSGQYGVCIFPDESECEEWAYMRGECKSSLEKKLEEEKALQDLENKYYLRMAILKARENKLKKTNNDYDDEWSEWNHHENYFRQVMPKKN